MRTACLLLVATTTMAAASPPELALGEEQMAIEPRDYTTDSPDLKRWARFAGFAQITGGGRAGGDVGAGGALSLGGLRCDLLATSLHLRFRPFADGGEPLGQLDYSVCPFAVLMTLKFDGRRGSGIVPGLDARRSLWNRAYKDEYDRMTVGFGPMWKNDGDPEHTVLVMSIGHGTTTQEDSVETRTTKTLDVDVIVYRLFVPAGGFGLDAIAFTSNALKAGTSNTGGVVSAFMPVRLRWDTPALYARAQAGVGIVGGQLSASGTTEVDGEVVDSWSETIDGEGLPELTEWVGELEAGMKRDRISASGRVARGFFPTFDGNVAREARVSGNLTWVAGRTRRTSISLSPFAARTRTWLRDARTTREISGGARLHVGREINRKLRVDAIGEAGVSPYARAETERLEGGYLGGQFLVALSGRVTELQR